MKYKILRMAVRFRRHIREISDPEQFTKAKRERIKSEMVEFFLAISWIERMDVLDDIYEEVLEQTLLDAKEHYDRNKDLVSYHKEKAAIVAAHIKDLDEYKRRFYHEDKDTERQQK